MGSRELVGLRGYETAHTACGSGVAIERQQALSHLCGVLRCHSLRDGARLPGLPLPLWHAPGYECSRAQLFRALSPDRIAAVRQSPDRWNERGRQDRAFSAIRTTGISFL